MSPATIGKGAEFMPGACCNGGFVRARGGYLIAVVGLGRGDASETVYLVMTFDDAERVAHEGFADRCYGALRGVMTTTTPPGLSCVSADTAVIAVLLDPDAFEPYAFSETEACIPAEILNAGYAELVEPVSSVTDRARIRLATR
jgi:hypothetical protein